MFTNSERPAPILRFFACVAIACCISCTQESDASIRKKLDVILQDDLQAIIEGISQEGKADTPYYSIVSYEGGKKGIYAAKAVVDFYILKNIKMKIHRKYRYLRQLGLWDRYVNEWVSIHDASTAMPQGR